jgi:hypothetical protein
VEKPDKAGKLSIEPGGIGLHNLLTKEEQGVQNILFFKNSIV